MHSACRAGVHKLTQAEPRGQTDPEQAHPGGGQLRAKGFRQTNQIFPPSPNLCSLQLGITTPRLSSYANKTSPECRYRSGVSDQWWMGWRWACPQGVDLYSSHSCGAFEKIIYDELSGLVRAQTAGQKICAYNSIYNIKPLLRNLQVVLKDKYWLHRWFHLALVTLSLHHCMKGKPASKRAVFFS